MISIKNIAVISKFETRILWRNWFFKIFGILAIIILGIFNLVAFTPLTNPRWFFIANSWNIPYANMLLLSIGQTAAIIFLAAGSISKNKKIDTNEVFYVRALSNSDYVLGKAFAIFKLFFWLNLVVLIPGLIMNLTNPEASFNFMAFFVYPLLVSIPTIIFLIGLVFFTATLLRNQPVTIIMLLGLSALVLFYFLNKYDNILDFMAFRLNMMASELAGFSRMNFILLQRGFYILSGFTCLFAAAFFLNRLANHRRNKIILGVVILFFAIVASWMMSSMWQIRNSKISIRQELIDMNGRWSEKPNVELTSNHVTITHHGNTLDGLSILKAINRSNQVLDTIFFTLNPELQVNEVKINEKPVLFDQQLQIVSVPLSLKIKPDEMVNLTIGYSGQIDERVAHLEVTQKRYEEKDQSFIFPIGKRYAFLQPDYVLLTKDVLWYPDTQVGYSKTSPIRERSALVDFKLDVKVNNSLTAISQGQSRKTEEGVFQFRPEYPLPQISLTIGNYLKKSVSVDSVDYELYHYPQNDYFSSFFTEIGDTLSFLIKDLKNGYEHDQKLNYPFHRLQLVESPIQFSAYDKIYENHQSYIQPEVILLPESGGDIRSFDLKRQFRSMDQQAKRENKVMSDKEKQANVFNTIIKGELTKQIANNFFLDGANSDQANYSIFPNLFDYNSGIVSNDWPTINRSLASYLNNEKRPENDYSRNLNGISFAEECNELMSRNSLIEILTSDEKFDKINKSIELKGEYLFSILEQQLGNKRFKEFMYAWINRNQHKRNSFSDLRNAIQTEFETDIDQIIKRIYSDQDQPAFEIENLQKFEILDGDRKRYQLLVDIENTGKNDGVVRVKFDDLNTVDQFGFRTSNQVAAVIFPEYLSVIKRGEKLQLGFLLDSKPNQISINTLVSQNIPSVINLPVGQFKTDEKMIPFEGERSIIDVTLTDQYQVIVDNEDPGFTTFSPIKDTYLKEYLDRKNPNDKKYYGIWGGSFSKWLPTTGPDYYGQHIRSAHFTRAGNGEKTATWKPTLKEEGFYDLYVFLKGKNQGDSYNSSSGRNYTYQYTINHADGKDEINFNLANADRGWNYLGSYYLTKEGTSVELSDRCDQRRVFADAVKWVKQ